MTINLFIDEENFGNVSQIDGTKEEIAEIIKEHLDNNTVLVTIKNRKKDPSIHNNHCS